MQIDSDGGQASDSSVNSGNKDVFVVNLFLYNPRTIRFVRFGMWCHGSERLKRLFNQTGVNCSLDMIGRSDIMSFYGTEKNICLGHRGLSGTKKTKTSFSLGRSAESFVVSLLSDQLAQREGTVTFRNHSFSWKQVQEREDLGGSTTGPGAAETAASVMGSGVSGLHERRSIKFRLPHSG